MAPAELNLKFSSFNAPPTNQVNALTATIENPTSVSSGPVTVAFYLGDPRSGSAVEVARTTVTVAPGSWNVASSPPGYHADGTLWGLCVNPDKNPAETNWNDNCGSVVVSSGTVDLAISPMDMRTIPVGPDVGELTTVSATVRNSAAVSAQAVVRFWLGHPALPDSVVAGEAPIAIPARGSAVASLQFLRPGEETNVWASLNNAVPRDSWASNDLAARNMFVKTIVDSGNVNRHYNTNLVVGDLLGTGRPVVVFGETPGAATTRLDGRVTAS